MMTFLLFLSGCLLLLRALSLEEVVREIMVGVTSFQRGVAWHGDIRHQRLFFFSRATKVWPASSRRTLGRYNI